MGECRRCKHWELGDDGDDGEAAPDWGECTLARSIGGRALTTARAVARDHEGYRAYLTTHRTFGCNQYKPDTIGREGGQKYEPV